MYEIYWKSCFLEVDMYLSKHIDKINSVDEIADASSDSETFSLGFLTGLSFLLLTPVMQGSQLSTPFPFLGE